MITTFSIKALCILTKKNNIPNIGVMTLSTTLKCDLKFNDSQQ